MWGPTLENHKISPFSKLTRRVRIFLVMPGGGPLLSIWCVFLHRDPQKNVKCSFSFSLRCEGAYKTPLWACKGILTSNRPS